MSKEFGIEPIPNDIIDNNSPTALERLALNIIKEKRVNVNAFLKSAGAKGRQREWQYNKTITDKTRWLTPLEFDLLKGVLK